MHTVLDVWRRLGTVLAANLNAVAFFAGFGLFGYGVARWSPPAAFVTLGLTLMLIAAWPYLRRPRKS